MKSTRKILIIVAILLGLAVVSVGIAYAITNGEPDAGRHPYVGLLVFDDAPGHPAWRCSGSLLSPTVV
ncbi:MAG: serine protease, partial [Anaerolineae bacterium]|nr:serine protease [Anaerolineae bacterium]